MSGAEQPRAWVFRDCRTVVPVQRLLRDFRTLLTQARSSPSKTLDILIASGGLECALADEGDPTSRIAADLTDVSAFAMLEPTRSIYAEASTLLDRITSTVRASSVTISPPEGFAYYALHPLQFAEPVPTLQAGIVTVIGIRTIGTVLSAIHAATMAGAGWRVVRITVRPRGHPYGRTTSFTSEQVGCIHSRIAGQFVVVDEGPGLSGSSFLSVGEALTKQGVPASSITFLGTREPDLRTLCAENAAKRWTQFRWRCTRPHFTPQRYGSFWGGGRWRNTFFDADTEWPAVWPNMENLKFLTSDHRRILKFEGLGQFGEPVRQRAQQLADSGYGPPPYMSRDGLTEYPFVRANPLSAEDTSSDTLEMLAEYCAFRATAFPSSKAASLDMAEVTRFNCLQDVGIDPALTQAAFCTDKPVIADARMQPHEWLRTSDHRFSKVDGCAHGDNHFFPGPTDVAWDLAGVIVEWRLNKDAADFFLDHYRKCAGDNPRSRLAAYRIAYSSFRLALCKMACSTVDDLHEQIRLKRDHAFYRGRLIAALRLTGASTAAKRAREESL
jgi:hypothetical protein